MELSTYFRINNEESGQFERTLIIADEGSYVSYLEGCTAPMRDENQLHAAVVELVALKDADKGKAAKDKAAKGDADDVCVHVHFGMAGNWAVFEGDEADTTTTTRLRMEGGGVVSHLSAMTVKHGSRAGLYEPTRATLGAQEGYLGVGRARAHAVLAPLRA